MFGSYINFIFLMWCVISVEWVVSVWCQGNGNVYNFSLLSCFDELKHLLQCKDHLPQCKAIWVTVHSIALIFHLNTCISSLNQRFCFEWNFSVLNGDHIEKFPLLAFNSKIFFIICANSLKFWKLCWRQNYCKFTATNQRPWFTLLPSHKVSAYP